MSGTHTQTLGFHVKEGVAKQPVGEREDHAQFPVQQSALSFAPTPAATTPLPGSALAAATSALPLPIPHARSGRPATLYRISANAKAQMGPSSMSPGLAMSQGDMTLAEHSHLTPGVKKMMRSVVRGLKAFQEPEAAMEGLGGTYFFKSETGGKIAIMKPCDEEPMAPSNPKGFRGRQLGEPGLKPTVRVGEAASREVAAYLLDHDGRAGVPHTVMVRMAHPIFHYDEVFENAGEDDTDGDGGHGSERTHPMDGYSTKETTNCATYAAPPENEIAVTTDAHNVDSSELPLKLGSLQSFVRHECDTTEMGPKFFGKKDVHRIGILDVRLFNTDRHGGNILVQRVATPKLPVPSGINPHFGIRDLGRDQQEYRLVPIDHGFALPEGLEPPYYEWQHWPQAMLPFDKEELAYIASLDAKADVELLRKELPDIHEASFRVLELSTLLLQKAAAAGLTLSEIAGVLTRPICIDEEPSELERMCFEIRQEMYIDKVERLRSASVDRAAGYLSSMTLDHVAEGDDEAQCKSLHVVEKVDSDEAEENNGCSLVLNAHLSGNMDDLENDENEPTPTIVKKSISRKQTDFNLDGLFSMDEDGGAKTPTPGSPMQTIRGKVGMYIEAPTLRVKPTGEIDHLSTPFGTTFKSVLGGATGSSPSYDSESPTHPLNELDEVDSPIDLDLDIGEDAAPFRGVQSYIPTLAKVPISTAFKSMTPSVMNARDRSNSSHPAGNAASTSFIDPAMSMASVPSIPEPRGCHEPSFVLKDMNEREWAIFMAKAEEKIANKLASGAWVDSFGSHQMVQMSCPV